jgi:hypothetical protein
MVSDMALFRSRYSLPIFVGAAALAAWGLLTVAGALDSSDRSSDGPVPPATAPQPRTDLVGQGSPTTRGNQPPDPDSLADGAAPRVR